MRLSLVLIVVGALPIGLIGSHEAFARIPSSLVDSSKAKGPSANKPENEEVHIVLPKSVDLRSEFKQWELTPKSQGRRNTCSVFTVASALEFAISRQREEATSLSVEYLNWSCNRLIHNKTRDRGQFFDHLLKAYARDGICYEKDMPYLSRFDPNEKPSGEAKENAKAVLSSEVKIHWINPRQRKSGLSKEQFLKIKQVLAKGWPVGAGASHSRLLVGYRDDPKKPGGGVFLTKDSGKGAYAQVTYAFVKKKVSDVFWIESN